MSRTTETETVVQAEAEELKVQGYDPTQEI